MAQDSRNTKKKKPEEGSSWLSRAVPVEDAEVGESSWLSRATPIEVPVEPAKESDWLSRAMPAEDTDPAQTLEAPKPVSDVDREIEERSAFNKPAVIPEVITNKELAQIAKKHDVPVKTLRDALSFFGGRPEDITARDVVGGTLGLGSEMLLGAGQKAYKTAQSPKVERALDDLQEFAAGRKSYLQKGAEFALPVVGQAAAIGKGALTAAKVGAGMGAVAGVSGSRQGQELTSGIVGAGLGAGLNVGFNKLLGKVGAKAVSRAERELESTMPKVDIEAISKEALSKTQTSNKILEDLSFGNKSIQDLVPAELNSIVNEQVPKEVVAEVLKGRGDIGKQITKQLIREGLGDTPLNRAAKLAERVAQEDRIEFLTRAGVKPASNKIDDVQEAFVSAQRQGPDYLRQIYKDHADIKAFRRQVEDSAIRDLTPTGKLDAALSYKISDGKFAMRMLDNKLGSEGEKLLTDLSSARNKLSYIRSGYRKEMDELYRQVDKSGTFKDATETGRLADVIEGKAKPQPNDLPTVELVKNYTDRLYNFVTKKAKEEGIDAFSFPKRDKYLPNMMLSVPETISKVQSELTKAVQDASQETGKKLSSLSQLPAREWAKVQDSDSVKNLVDFLNIGLAKEARKIPRSGAELEAMVMDATNSSAGVAALDKLARGIQARTGSIPDFVKEKNIFKALDRYTYDTLSNLYQRNTLSKLRNLSEKMEAVGARAETDYLKNLLQDITGVREGTVAAWQRDFNTQVSKKLDASIEQALKEGKNAKATALGSIKYMGDIPALMSRQIYPNVLGWNLRPIVQNMLSGVARLAPELGTKYGYSTYLRGTTYAVKNQAELSKDMIRLGLVPNAFTREGEQALAEGIMASKAGRMSADLLESSNKIGMSLFQGSEHLNRISVLGTAKMMANDIAKGSKLALDSLNKFPPYVRKEVVAANGDTQKIYETIGKYLNATTAFNYDRPTLFELGRTLGPLFSTFAKWPTSVFGEALADLKTAPTMPAAVRRVAERLVLPFIGFAAIDHAIRDELDEKGRTAAIVGSRGISSAAPVSSLGSVVSGGIFTPPMIDTVVQGLVVPALSGDPNTIGKGLDRAAFTYLPGAGFTKFLTDTLPTYIQDERPEGPTGTERVINAPGTYRRILK